MIYIFGVRVTCRQLRVEAVLHPPLLSDGEGLASRVIQLTPAAFLSPVLLEVHHATPVTKDREVVVYRCDSGRKWSQHINVQPDSCLNNFLRKGLNILFYYNYKSSPFLNEKVLFIIIYIFTFFQII